MSPDGKQLGFFTDVSLKKIEISGWPPQTLSSVSSAIRRQRPVLGKVVRLADGLSTWRVAFDLRCGDRGRRAQDVWVRGIRPEVYKLAIRLVGLAWWGRNRGGQCRRHNGSAGKGASGKFVNPDQGRAG